MTTILRLQYRKQSCHREFGRGPADCSTTLLEGLCPWPAGLLHSCLLCSTPFRPVLGLMCCGTLCPGAWEMETPLQTFPPQRTRQHTGKVPKEGTPASQELTALFPSCPPLGAPFPPSFCSQQAGPGTRSHAAVLLPGELGGRLELCREKARPVKVSEMNHRHPCAAGLRCVSGSCSMPENSKAQ